VKNTLFAEMMPFRGCIDNKVNLKSELFVALTGAVLVIPQAITFSYLAGLPPEYGLYSAIFMTFFAAMFGCSPMVGGPNTTSAILIGGAVLPLAGRGSSTYIEYVLLLTFMVGVIQLLIWLLRGGRYFQYFSPVVITAITTGVGSLIMLSALDGITGINTTSVDLFYQRLYLQIIGWSDLGNNYALIIGGITLLTGWITQRFLPRAYIIISVVVGYLVSMLLHASVPQVETQVEFIGLLPFSLLPFSVPNIDFDNMAMMMNLFDSALIIALIGLAQTMVIIKDIKIQKRQTINDEKEIFAQAASNLLGAFFSSFAGAGSFNRTNVALTMGASTPIATLFSSVFVILIILVLQSIMVTMPMPAMAAILFLVGAGMIKPKKIRAYHQTRQNAVLFWLTYLTLMFIGLKAGIGIAIFLSVIIFLIHANQLEITDTKPADFQVITIHGNFFYASIDQLLPHFEQRECHLILCLDFVSYFDDVAAEYIQQEYVLRSATQHHLFVVTHSQKHKECLQRTANNNGAKVFENYGKARTALEVINVQRFLRTNQQKPG
jgi:SulP family sulfate permease